MSRIAVPLVMVAMVTMLGTLTAAVGARAQELDPDLVQEQILELRSRGRFAEALELARELRAGVETSGDFPAYVAGDARRQVATLEAILALDTDARRQVAIADSLDAVIYQLYDDEDYLGAAEAARRQFQIRKRYLGVDNKETADAALAFGTVLEDLDRLEESLELYSVAFDVYSRTCEPVHRGRDALLNNMSFLYEKLGRYDEMLSTLRRCLAGAISLYGAESEEVATTCNNLGAQLTDLGQYAEAEEMLRRSLRIRRALGDGHGICQSLHNIAVNDLKQGRLVEAGAEGRRALAVADSLGPVDVSLKASILNAQAVIAYRQMQYEAAVASFRNVLEMRLQVWPEASSPVALARIDLANALAHVSAWNEADRQYATADSILRISQGDKSPNVLYSLANQATALRLRGRYETAAQLYARAADVYEGIRQELGGVGLNDDYASPWAEFAATLRLTSRDSLAWQAAETGQGRLVADALDRGGAAALGTEDADVEALLSQYQRAQAAFLALDSDQGDDEMFSDTWAELMRVRADLAERVRQLRTTTRRQEREVYGLRRVQGVLRPDEAICGWLVVDEGKPTAVAWGYVIRDSGPVFWTRALPVRNRPEADDPPSRFRELVRSGEDHGAVGAIVWRQRIESLLPGLTGVRRLIVVPSGDVVGVPLAVVGPAGKATLGDRYLISYSPSATVFARYREQRAARPSPSTVRRILALGDPPFNEDQALSMQSEAVARPWDRRALNSDLARDPTSEVTARDRSVFSHDPTALARLPRLRSSRREALRLGELGAPGSRVLVGPACCEDSLSVIAHSTGLASFGLIHIGTHAFVDPVAPERSFMVLSQIGLLDPLEALRDHADYRDGLLTVSEILNGWSLDADLVTVSGCETGLGRRVAGEGYLGFTSAFLQRGASTVLVSLWPVDDQATSILLKRFYELYLGASSAPLGKVESLARAQEYLRDYGREELGVQPYAKPRYWAGFVLVGEGD
ncbi:MAG TPA: CHAT domain-containing protein [Candidatus Krumholzibacteria bacterium]|nr:CHAT domain-containing protein [Candidatus Krumholzibacteria bacterium]HPD72957.1 CHAT domain-containing protein [Candidatus Krumholzibacteria bacterium]HRY41756.1 CHAT domain-containing protein [Candidatus Krumholzibacteria bacterium]